ncbi:MAG: septation protein A [Hyphomonadaceae bacterium]|nr:septation protein A [Hyphomonadaceae bacterium]
MTDTPVAEQTKEAPKGGTAQLLVDLGPVIVFMLTYNLGGRFVPKGQEIFLATGVFLVATLLAVGYAWLVQKRLPPMLIVTAVIVTVFGGLTLMLQDALFIKIKPTIVNLLYAGVILGGLAVKQNVWKMLFKGAFPTLPDAVWTTFALRWGLFFIFLAGLNEYVWRTYSEAFWANFKVLGVMPLTFLFMLANMPLLMKHMPKDGK